MTDEALLDALRLLARVDKDDRMRLVKSRGWDRLVVVRERDAVRDLIGLALDLVTKEKQGGLC